MKSIDRKDFLLIGSVVKIHGNKGELKVRVDQKIYLSALSAEKEWTFLEIRNKPVPFFIESFKATFETEGLLKLRDVNSFEEAGALLGYNLLAPGSLFKKQKKSIDQNLSSFLLIDKELGPLGKIERLEELPEQLLFVVNYEGREVLIPAVEEFILEIDTKKKIIQVELPEGLLEQ